MNKRGRPTTPLIVRFWTKVKITRTCWVWQGKPNFQGYGQCNRGGRFGRSPHAHIIAWELEHDRPVADGMQVNHHCDNRLCVNPQHLYEGTQAQNMRDRQAHGAGFRQLNHSNRGKVARAKCLRLAGTKVKTIAKELGVSRHTVTNWTRKL